MRSVAKRVYVGAGVTVATLLGGFTSLALAAGEEPEATYPIGPVVTKTTTDLGVDMPVLLAVVGGLIALVVAYKAFRKFFHV